MSYEVVFDGGSAQALTAAAYCAQAGRRTLVAEPGPRVGGELATESFLSPFRFDLELGFFLRAPSGFDPIHDLTLADLGLRVAHPDVPLAVAFDGRPPFRLHRDWGRTLLAAPGDAGGVERMLADGRVVERLLLRGSDEAARALVGDLAMATARQALDHYGIRDGDLRCALTYLPLAFGLATDRPGGGLAVALLAASIERFTVVSPGTGALCAALVDRIVCEGGAVIEGRAADEAGEAVVVHERASREPTAAGSVRLYLGVVGERPRGVGHVTVIGVEGEDAIEEHLAAVRAGRVPGVAGHFTVRSDVGPPGGELRSIVWQGPFPAHAGGEDDGSLRASLTARCLAVLGDPPAPFAVSWLPHETLAEPAELDWGAVTSGDAAQAEWLRAGPQSVLTAITGLAVGRRLFETLAPVR